MISTIACLVLQVAGASCWHAVLARAQRGSTTPPSAPHCHLTHPATSFPWHQLHTSSLCGRRPSAQALACP